MSAHDAGNKTAKGWAGRKYYLSQEAIALLVEHCKGTPLTMSAYLDQLIKRELDSPAERFLRGDDHRTAAEREQRREEKEMLLGPEVEVKKVLAEGRRQLEELRAPTLTPDARSKIIVEPKQPRKDFKVDL